MYGNVLSNAQVHQLQLSPHSGFTLRPYRQDRLKLAHYRLSAGVAKRPKLVNGKWRRDFVHDFADGVFPVPPNDYLLVQIQETILLPDGIVGNFVPASTLVEQGFGLVAGKLDPDYGRLEGETQHIILGLKNLLDETNPYDPDRGLAHIYFVDFRGTQRLNWQFSQEELDEFKDRRFRRDDGPDYTRDDPDE